MERKNRTWSIIKSSCIVNYRWCTLRSRFAPPGGKLIHIIVREHALYMGLFSKVYIYVVSYKFFFPFHPKSIFTTYRIYIYIIVLHIIHYIIIICIHRFVRYSLHEDPGVFTSIEYYSDNILRKILLDHWLIIVIITNRR